ncbi:putative ankyrin repeat-containing protein [Talaromyces proteolyticus]|uniref:Ankyrin repeat-containing protein n=1 Tax=Talaromyces proteolyticus TaxID=1131652 RepID=A0AAD4KXS1_9EURO|nr:putative ankyrin repeat-containing protein [Talaromyces proteolyticus]KAH8703510.1 putative ankyrin repeat-containing protein [Talaromyces proteolyticus]
MPLHQLLPDTQSLTEDQIKVLEQQIKVDIIAVHGLNPWSKTDTQHAWDTWQKPAGLNGRLWLRDDLKEKTPEARVFLYQYNSKLVWGGDKASFLLKADEFLEAIRLKRKKTPQRPIIFIGHSLGGLLIEQALVNSHNSRRYGSIEKATTGLVFFGTPHGGGNPTLVTIGSAAARVARVLGAQKSMDIEQTLQSGSLFTEILQHSFRNQLMNYQIVSFWEGKGNIVDRKSAMFGLPDHVEQDVELKATHGDMCRFDTENEEDKEIFNIVWGNLEDLYDKALERAREKWNVLEWLHHGPVDTRHLDIQQARRGNGQWLIRHDIFQGWIANNISSRILWANGIAGSGKTFLSSFIIDHLFSLTATSTYGVAYIYLEFQESTRQTSHFILSCLLKQLADQNDAVMDYVKSRKRILDIEHRVLSTQDIIDCLIASVSMYERIFIVIDALDEQGDIKLREQLLQDLHKIVHVGAFCYVTSRPNIRGSFRDVEHLEIQPADEDIRAYVEDYIDNHPSARALLGQSFREKVVDRLTECADGMFLPVRFQIEYLCQQTTLREVMNQLDTLSETMKAEYILDTSYERAIKCVQGQPAPKRNLAHSIFRWLIASKRILTVMELCTALAVAEGASEIDELAIPSSDMVIDVCGGFVTLDEASKSVRIAHATAKDYLLKVLPELAKPDQSLAVILATYLTFNSFEVSHPMSQESFNKRREIFPLLDYAAHNLSLHAISRDGTANTQLDDIIFRIVTTPGLAWSFLQAFYAPSDTSTGYDWFPRESSSLHVATTIGLIGVVKRLLKDEKYDSQISEKNVKGQTPLHIAAIYGRLDIAEYFLQKDADSADPDRYGFTPFLYAASEGHIAIVELFLKDKKVRPELVKSTLNNGDTALHLAAAKGHHAVALLLLQSDAQVDAKNKKGVTPKDLAMKSTSVSMQNTIISWLDMKSDNQQESHRSFYRPIWGGIQGMVVDIVGRAVDRISTPRTDANESRSLTPARGVTPRRSAEQSRPLFEQNVVQTPEANEVPRDSEGDTSSQNSLISFSDFERNTHYVLPASMFERVIELSDRQCMLVDTTAANNSESQHPSQDPLRLKWVCLLEADTNLRCLFTGLPKGRYKAVWKFTYMVTSQTHRAHLFANTYNCTFGRAVDQEMFIARTTNPLQPFISTILNFIDPRQTSQLTVPQYEPLEGEIPNIVIHRVHTNLAVNLETTMDLMVDWDGPVAFLIKKVGLTFAAGFLSFNSVEMVKINQRESEEMLPMPLEVR